MTTCVMVIIETSKFKYFWECSECKTQYKDTFKFQLSKTCPNCGAKINDWVGMDDEYDE